MPTDAGRASGPSGVVETTLGFYIRAVVAKDGGATKGDINGKSCRRSLDGKWVALTTPARNSREPSLVEIASRDYAEASYTAHELKVIEAKSEQKKPSVPKVLDGF